MADGLTIREKEAEMTTNVDNREPFITDDSLAWHYEEPVSGRLMTYTMGYMTDDLIPCMALFAGEDNEPCVIPVDVMVHAIELAAKKEQAEAK
jgi:hypothetical protein